MTLVVKNVGPDGLAELSAGNSASYMFRSPAASPKVRDPSSSVFADCFVAVTVSTTGVITARSPGSCGVPFVAKPRCSMRQVATRAGVRPGAHTVVQLTVNSLRTVWRVSEDGPAMELDDDC